MEENQNTPAPPQRWAGRRGASTAAAAAILVVVIVIVGAGGYFGLNAATPASHPGTSTTATTKTCAPANSPTCKNNTQGTNPNDVVLTVPYQAGYGQTIGEVSQGTSVPASLSVSGHEAVNSWSVNWGDGTTNTSTSPLLTHIYNVLGEFTISGSALVGTTTHIGTGYLFPILVTPSITTNTAGTFPGISATLSNGSSSANNNPWIRGSGTFTVSGTYTGEPSNTAWLTGTATLVASGGTLTTTSSSTSGAAGTLAVNTPGVYTLTMVGPITNVLSGVTVYQNYTWGFYVSATNYAAACTSCGSISTSNQKSPHAGTIDNYEVVPGGATSIDPAIDYESVGYEVIANVYQTLVYYNGTSSSSFLPEIATCVPGTAACSAQYGSPLLVNGNPSSAPGGALNGLPQYWTFVIDKKANFYDPAHSASWGVYPTDVMASLARTAAFSEVPFVGSAPGWIQTQSLLQIGNPAYDGALHFPFNTTGASILSSMLINDSAYCPAAAITGEHGCITFNASGLGSDWPFFLELVSDPNGAGIQPCGWFGYVGAGIPGFTTTVASGDGPCALPGGAGTGGSTNSSAWQSYLASITPTGSSGFIAWDTYEGLGANSPNVFTQTRFSAIGSGPYYVASLTRGVGFVLEANPAYAQPNCAGTYWCQPAVGTYAKTVNTFWEPNDQVGIQEYIQGKADFAGIQSTDTSTLLNLGATGKLGILNAPTISIFFDPINLEVNTNIISQYYTGSVHLPTSTGPGTASDFFSYIGLRQFLVNAFPYTQDIQQVLTVDGIQLGFNYGGAIPKFLGNYYATNVTWPAGQPDPNPADVGGAAWWWAQANSASSPYYDPLLSQCTAANPCTFPVGGEQGDTVQNGQFPLWAAEITALTGGKIAFTEVDLTFSNLVVYSLVSKPYTDPLTIYVLGWLPDYPDPTDYTVPLYYPDATYTAGSAVFEALSNYTSSTDPLCPAADQTAAGSAISFAALAFWTHATGVPNDCQGWAYNTLVSAVTAAGAMPVGPLRTLYFNMASHIANDLALYLYQFQEQLVGTYAPWISPASINLNVVLGGDLLFGQLQGNGLV